MHHQNVELDLQGRVPEALTRHVTIEVVASDGTVVGRASYDPPVLDTIEVLVDQAITTINCAADKPVVASRMAGEPKLVIVGWEEEHRILSARLQ
jgi:hypothetical protein